MSEAALAPASQLRVGGFVPFTTSDYPDALAAVIFCQGCPWRCTYCHNPHLIPAEGRHEHEFPNIVDWLGARRGLLDAVVFSGGEPTAQPALPAAIESVRELGFSVGLHTAGAYPRRLAQVLPRVHWVGIDVKARGAGYPTLTGGATSGKTAFASLDLVIGSGVAYEVRTTVHPALLTSGTLVGLACELAQHGVVRWILQIFRARGCASDELAASANAGWTADTALLAQLSRYVPSIELRG